MGSGLFRSRRFFLLFLSFSCLMVGRSQLRYTNERFASRSEVLARNGMVATSHPLATQAGLDILKKGGTAVDAAIAANAVLGLVEPTGCGIGGDLFAIVWDAKARRLFGLNGSGRSPRGMSAAFLREKGITQIPRYGALSVSVPGCVDAWFELHGRFGRLPMKDLLSSGIEYAEEGFPVTEVIAFLWKGYAETLKGYKGYRDLYMPGGRTPGKGDVFTNTGLASSLREISRLGRDGFYKGRIAEGIVQAIREGGGLMSLEDLSAHRAEWVSPISTDYRGYEIWQLPPNSQGLALLQMMNLLENYDIRRLGFPSPDYIHLLVEAKKLVYEDRAAFYADGLDSGIVRLLSSKAYARTRRERINGLRAADDIVPGSVPPFGNTIYLTVADREGNMVSLIQSNFAGMGSGIVPEGLGFSLQNRGCSFSLDPGSRNQ
ncbi:MAG: gamma-glutamyltransferase family protein, partial [Chitinophagia bacterium]|nr:gamma-glutamyltransferase family protein [Chitinophagia bacterium]